MSTYTIGQVAERSGFSASALRYYEQHDLLEPVERTDACTLPAEEMPDRAGAWQELVGYVRHREPVDDGPGVRLLLDPEVPLDELARLAVAEQGCCTFFDFAITVDQRGIALEVRAPDDAAEVVTAMFGAAA